MLKQQQFHIIKFSSARLKKSGFVIENISLDEARSNSELISINNSQLIRTIFSYKKREFNQKILDNLLISLKIARKSPNSEENKQKLLEISEKIENLLFVEDLISVEFDNKAHYKEILKINGFFVNGIRFVPFMASAGMIRKNTALFINNNLKYQILKILENGRNPDVELVPAKWGAYFSLYSSSTLPVSLPKMIVVKDKEIETTRRVNFVKYQGKDVDDLVEEKDLTFTTNAFDGQGLISPLLAKRWSEEIGLDYVFSSAIVRNAFLKGLVVTFDFIKFAEEVAKTYSVIDIYGIEHDIRDVELIISESQFKLWNAYENVDEYIYNCEKNKIGFGIAKVNPKKEKSFSRTSYQFLQVLNLNDVDIAKLCEPSVRWVRDVSGLDANSMILYATGETNFEPKDFNKMDVTTKAILLNPDLARDRYIQSKFIKTIEKRKTESYMGSILINANYQFIIADPYYQACCVFNLEKEPLLRDREHYSEYWQSRDISQVCAIRSPIVHHSEVNILNLQNREDTRYWYEHIHSGIIYPAYGIGMDMAIHGGGDSDGDLVCTVNNPVMIKGKIDGLPVFYESIKSKKEKIDATDDEKQVQGQLLGYNSKVGFATNISSSLYTLLEEFPRDSKEYEIIQNRLIIGRVIQGEIIDSVKGLQVPPFREHWTKYKHISEDMTPEEKEYWTRNNKILCEIRPAFFRFLYPHYMTRYNKEIKKYNIYSHLAFKKDFQDVLKSPVRTDEENDMIERYRWNSFFLDNNSVVNKISHYMRTSIGLVSRFSNKSSRDFDYRVLLSKNFIPEESKLNVMKEKLQNYKTFKRGMWRDLEFATDNLDVFISYLKKECYKDISSSERELADYAVEITYGGELSFVEFAWKMFPTGILENIQTNSDNTIKFPVRDEQGDIEYLWNKYSLIQYSLEELHEEKLFL